MDSTEVHSMTAEKMSNTVLKVFFTELKETFFFVTSGKGMTAPNVSDEYLN
jgi:hypothetical protein